MKEETVVLLCSRPCGGKDVADKKKKKRVIKKTREIAPSFVIIFFFFKESPLHPLSVRVCKDFVLFWF